jgi:hypothetical protein
LHTFIFICNFIRQNFMGDPKSIIDKITLHHFDHATLSGWGRVNHV